MFADDRIHNQSQGGHATALASTPKLGTSDPPTPVSDGVRGTRLSRGGSQVTATLIVFSAWAMIVSVGCTTIAPGITEASTMKRPLWTSVDPRGFVLS
jgi:hypothetical protein